MKGKNETIRAFAQRWRALATQVKPSIPEDELVDLFLKSLPFEFFDKLNTSGCQTFAHLIKVAERYEWAVREKRAPEPSFRRQYPTRKERENTGEVAFVPHPPPPKKFMNPTQRDAPWSAQKKWEPKKRLTPNFTPLPRPLAKLLPMLLEGRLVAKKPPRKNPPRFPGFDENQSCAFHMGEKGHTADNCLALKYEVQALIDGGVLEFDKSEPNVQQNPLPEHPEVNAILDEQKSKALEFLVNEDKMTTILKEAAAYPAERKATEEEKLSCLNKLEQLGIITEADGILKGGRRSSFDLSSDKVILNIKSQRSQKALEPAEPTGTTQDESDEDEKKLKKARQGDRRFLQHAQERGAVVDSLGQDSGRYNFKVLYSPPPWALMEKKEVIPSGWDDLDDPVNDEMVGAIERDIPDYDTPKVENIDHLERDRMLHLRLSKLEEEIVRLTHAIGRATQTLANTERPVLVENPYVYKVRKTMDWLTRHLIKLERKSKDVANTTTELIGFLMRGTDLTPDQWITFPEKYDGSSCPLDHASCYLQKMEDFLDDDQVLITNFRRSLQGPALRWFQSLDMEWVQGWEDFAECFMRKFEDQMEFHVTKERLALVVKDEKESFPAFARRWKIQARQVEPPLSEKQMVEEFIKNLPPEYRNRMAAYNYHSFEYMVSIGIRQEGILRRLRGETGRVPHYHHSESPSRAVYLEEDFPDNMEEEEIIAMAGPGAPYVIKLNKLDHTHKEENSCLEHVVIALSHLDLSKPSSPTEGKIQPVVIKIPPVEEYNSSAVPWDYKTGEIDAVMRSGRCYPPREGEPEKRPITKESAEQLQSVVRTSEYEIIEQLRKMPAQISLLDLFTNSEKHKAALLKVLSEAQVPETIDEAQLEELVGAVWLKDQIAFSDDDFPKEGRAHNKALYISARCKGKTVSRVLVDNGSAFNLCPLSTIRSLGISEDAIRTSKATIRAFDGGAKHVVGEIELDVIIGPVSFSIPFQVLDIPSTFSFLLGRPWIHVAGAVPSSLHQKVRFMAEDKIVTIHGESERRSYLKGLVPCVEPQDGSSYDSLERLTVMHVPEGTKVYSPKLSAPAIMAARVLLSHGFISGQGLGAKGQGMKSPLQLIPNNHGLGLGYTGDSKAYKGKGRGRGRVRGRGRRGGRNDRLVGTTVWKSQGKMFESPLMQSFSKVTRWLQDEDIAAKAEPDLSNPFVDDRVHVIIECLTNDASPSE